MSVRLEIAKMISEIKPSDLLEQSDQRFVKSWIASDAQIFRVNKPAVPSTHLVSYFVPYDKKEGKILLVHHKKAGLWLPPGGHVEVGEHPRDAAFREMKEGLGAEAEFLFGEPLFITVTKTVNETKPHTDVSLWYLVEGDSLFKYVFDENEFNEIAWFSLEACPQNQVEPHLHRFIKKLSQRIE